MVWSGLVWSGLVWYGMVWYGMVCYGMVWYAGYSIAEPWADPSDLVIYSIGVVESIIRDSTCWILSGV